MIRRMALASLLVLLPTSSACIGALTTAQAVHTPVASAGGDHERHGVDGEVQVVLDGSASCVVDDGTLTYSWSQVSGRAVTLSGADAAELTVTTSERGRFTFALTVSRTTAEGEVLSDVDYASIIVDDDEGDDITPPAQSNLCGDATSG